MTFSLVSDTESYICRKRFGGHSASHLYPSEASVRRPNEFGELVTTGACLRASFFRCMGETPRPTTPRSEMIFLLGKSAEELLKKQWHGMGLLVAESVRFENPDYRLHGELDAVLQEPDSDTLFGVEVKSYYGYQAGVEIKGNKHVKPQPKMNNLLQTLVYAYEFRDRLPYFKLFYLERGDGGRQEFNIKVVPDELEDTSLVYRPQIDGETIMSFTVGDIYARYAELLQRVKDGLAPPPEFDLYYDDAKIERLYERDQLSKTKYQAFHKKGDAERPGDWQCSYCSYKDICTK